MTDDRKQELQAKYSAIFEFGSKYASFGSFLNDMEKFARVEFLLSASFNKAIGYLYCLVDLCNISGSSVILKELFNFYDDLFNMAERDRGHREEI